MGATVLIVEGDPAIAGSIARSLKREGLEVTVAQDGPTGLAEAIAGKPDLVLLDLLLPEMDGLDVLRALRTHSGVPVIMLTSKAGETARVAGIELGADDYITKPVHRREVVARVKMVLRRAAGAAGSREEMLRARDIVVDCARRTVSIGDREVHLTPQEFALLECLARNCGRALTRNAILQQAWGEAEYIDSRTVDVHVRWLRQKIEDEPAAPTRLLTVRGVGYRLAG